MFERRLASPAEVWGRYGALVVLAALCLVPIWVMVGTSFKNEVLIFEGRPVWFLFFPTLDNYEYILTRGKFDRYLVNSVIVGTASTFLTLFFGACAPTPSPARSSGAGASSPTRPCSCAWFRRRSSPCPRSPWWSRSASRTIWPY